MYNLNKEVKKALENFIDIHKDEEPVYKGCKNEHCFCDGSCKERIGWKPKSSGFYGLPNIIKCSDPHHEPPMFIHIPVGKAYRHVCPSCGAVKNLISPQITY